MNQLEDLLRQCTVKLTLPSRMGWGTGFRVTSEWILTCAHVVREAEAQPIQVRWKNQDWAQAMVERSLPEPYDLALLRVAIPTDASPPCVYLDAEVQSRDPLYLFGYPDQDFPNGCPVTFSCEGLTGDEPAYIKFAVGQVRKGMSGSPLLNQRTGKVCGADLSLARRLKRLEDQQLAARALCRTDADMTAKLGVAAAFQLSWETLSTDAQQLGCGLSLFAAAPIPWSSVEQCFVQQDPEELEEWRDELLNLHLLQRVADSTYRLHPLIREFLRNKQNNLAAADEQKYNYCAAMVEVAAKIPDTPTSPKITALAPVIPHLTEAATNYKRCSSDEDLIWPFVGLGRFYQGQGAYAQALPWREQCLSFARERLGEHPAVATSYNNLAELYDSQGRYSEAEPLYKTALSLRQRLLGEEHPDVAQSYNNLARLYYLQGHYSEAESLYQQALSLRQRLLGEEHPDVAQSLNNLAAFYHSQGNYSEAEPLFEKALSMRRRLLGLHPDVAESLNNLASVYKKQERYSEAEPL